MIQETYVINIETKKEDEMILITGRIAHLVEQSNVKEGEVVLFVPHTTAAVTINENADPDVKRDMLLGLQKTFLKDANYIHFEGNSHAHIKSSVIGVDQTILISDSKMILGTWQGVYFMEFDGPRSRKLIVRIKGE